MANRLVNPRPQFMSSTPTPYSGGLLKFYASGTSTPLAVYSDATLSTSIGTSLELNSAGYYAGEIFLSNAAYKVVLEYPSGTPIWTSDPVSSSDFSTSAQFLTYAGNPNGSVAGTAGTGTIQSTVLWDRTNNILYVCTTTGTASTAVWTAINASASTPSVPPPQGRLTITSATPILAAGVTAATAVYYTPYTGNLVPIYNGTSTVPTAFNELTLTLASQHALSTIYDVFVFSNSGVMTLVTGPAWSSSAAASGSRGTGAGTTQISRLNGLWVNTVSMTGRNGSTTYTIGANLATYLGSIFIDGTAGQITCHTAFGQSRKWGVWNAYQRSPVFLNAGDGTASWTYNVATIRASNADGTNCLTTFSGLPEEAIEFSFEQSVAITGTTAGSDLSVSQIGIGVNSTTTYSGRNGQIKSQQNATTGTGVGADIKASHILLPTIGINTITSLEFGDASTGIVTTFTGTSASMLLQARWKA